MNEHIEILQNRFLNKWREYQQWDLTLYDIQKYLDNQKEYRAWAITMIRAEKESNSKKKRRGFI